MATNEPACGIDVGGGPSSKYILVLRTEVPSISLKRAPNHHVISWTVLLEDSARRPNERKTFGGTADRVVVVITQSS